MARPKAQSKFKGASEEVIEKNFLEETPEGFPEPKAPDRIVIANHIPEKRKIQFLNGRDPGCELMFHYSSKTHPLEHFILFHGQEYDLPIEIIEHLENNCTEKIYGYRQGRSGHPEMYVKSLKYLYSCKSPRRIA